MQTNTLALYRICLYVCKIMARSKRLTTYPTTNPPFLGGVWLLESLDSVGLSKGGAAGFALELPFRSSRLPGRAGPHTSTRFFGGDAAEHLLRARKRRSPLASREHRPKMPA